MTHEIEAAADAVKRDTTVPADLAEAAKVLEGVTPGPWTVEHKHGTTRLMMGDDCQMCDETYYPWVPVNEKDWHFIAWAREGVPALIATVTAQAARIEGLEKDVEKARRFRDIARAEAVDWHSAKEAAEAALTEEREKVAKLVEALDYLVRAFDRVVGNSNHFYENVHRRDVHLVVEEGAKIQSVADARAALAQIKGDE